MRRVVNNLDNNQRFKITLVSTTDKLMGDHCIEQDYTLNTAYQSPVTLTYSETDILFHTYNNIGEIIDGYSERTLNGVTPDTTPPADNYVIHYQAAPEITPLAKIIYKDDNNVDLVVTYKEIGYDIRTQAYTGSIPIGYYFNGWSVGRQPSRLAPPFVDSLDTTWADGEEVPVITARPIFNQSPTENDNSNQNTPTLTNPDDDSDTPIVDPNAGNNDSDVDLNPDNGILQP